VAGVTRRIPLLLLLVGGLVIAGCGSSSSTSSPGATTTAAGHPAGAQPSDSAKMICSSEAQTEIAASIGVKAAVSKPTWVDDVYACKYVYPKGTNTLSVKELNSKTQTTSVYNAFATKLGKRPEVVSFGEGAFITTNGSVVVRKDFKVLNIDVTQLPQQFGQPPQDRSNIALSIAATVMSCWTGE
jgi:hypothetical protein